MGKGLRDVYNSIAESWSKLKTKPFPFVLDFIKGRKGLFFVEGCGAGRHSSLVKPVVGIDFSFNMIRLAKKKDPEGSYLVADVRSLPFKDRVFDFSVSVAVLHHLKPEDCTTALRELKRVTKNESLLSVWRRDQERFDNSPNEVYVPFGGYDRYYYLYTEKEFAREISRVFTKHVSIPDTENLVFIVS